jgi:hypothetical protein
MNKTKSAKNYTPESVGFAGGMLDALSLNAGKTVFMLADYPKAKRLVKELLDVGRNIDWAELGLDGDWGENSTIIYEEGKFHKYNAYKGSLWATPMLIVYFTDDPNEAYECWKPEK